MGEHPKDNFPYQAVEDVSQLCRTDPRVHANADVKAAVQTVREHLDMVAARYRIDTNVLARVSASMMDPKSLSADWYLKAADDPEGDFKKTAKRMGYKRDTVMATTVREDGLRIEVALVRPGNWGRNWFVVEHIDCYPDDDSFGESSRDDYDDFATALASFEATVERHRVQPGMVM